MMKHLREYFETGQVTLIKNFENDPVKLFTKIYGVGPKKAAEFKRLGITTLQELKEREDELLTSAQKYGLQYYDDIQKRIPRKEIDAYDKIFKIVFDKVKTEHSEYKIVGYVFVFHILALQLQQKTDHVQVCRHLHDGSDFWRLITLQQV